MSFCLNTQNSTFENDIENDLESDSENDSENDFEVCSYSIGLTSGHGVTTTRGHFPTSKVISNDCAAQPVSNATVCDG